MVSVDLIKKIVAISIASILAVVLCVIFIPRCRGIYNTAMGYTQEVDDNTNYNTLKKVEDTCRAMIASYNADWLTYLQYKDSDDKEQRSWAEQAKMRANKTASSYNEYILKNSYVWKNNIPEDIKKELAYLE